jgi:hypothetical protein
MDNKNLYPKEIISAGYLYDEKFKLLEKRGKMLRKEMHNTGADFLIAFFDENVQEDSNKYGVINRKSYYSEIEPLFNLVLEDSSVGVVSKAQFVQNSLLRLFPNDQKVFAALATGRWREVCAGAGVGRNMVFPAEIAFSVDVMIGLAVGATASIEAALTGTPSLIIGADSNLSKNLEFLCKKNTLFDDMCSAIQAMEIIRSQGTEFRSIGNWSKLLPKMDPYRDGRASQRLRILLGDALRENGEITGRESTKGNRFPCS